MARKADDLLADLDQLGSEEQQQASTSNTTTTKNATKPAPKAAGASNDDSEDLFGDLEKTLAAKPATGSRPTTPRLSSSTTSGTNKSPKRAEHTPASSGPPSGRSSEDRLRSAATYATPAAPAARTSGEGRSYHQSYTPGTEPPQQQQSSEPPLQQDPKPTAAAGGGGWWGSVFSAASGAASAAVKQAETLAKDLQQNEEAKRWAESVKGYSANLSTLSTDIRSRALPTFTSLISHIAPPISAHERLQIHTTHDILNYPSLDPIIYSTFSRVMAQVEGGDLLVIQRGSESRARASSEPHGYKGSVLGGSGNGWTDGPWWRDDGSKRDLGAVQGLKEGTRLARVSAEAYAKEFFEPRGGVEEVARKATEVLEESNPTRRSDIFLAIQAIGYEQEGEMFAGNGRAEKTEEGAVVDAAGEDEVEELAVFAIYLYDPIHSLSFSTLSQPFPRRWAQWLDAVPNADEINGGLPSDIGEIIEGGGVDPREWVAEWMEEILALGVGVVAQRYVARRMGVGEAGSQGKARAKVRDDEAIAEAAARGV
ncbi:hypothetical protein LTR09_006083 [Extremus antarcticus]|uniref:Maintenance of telomere capping protein 1 n=1 Tax=Extremus antarcticus TaxID=702011 RepID=A0AAJ0GC33_9PEZI|nr:hypothetical protein LTR09_006083 [Extremus antarcticus]